jgi:hypothetical protein
MYVRVEASWHCARSELKDISCKGCQFASCQKDN